MKSLFAFAAAAAVLVVFAAPAAAQPAFRAEVPFSFSAGNQSLPAGEYQFNIDLQHMLTRIIPVEGGPVRLVRLVPGGEERALTAAGKGTLRFLKYGEKYILTDIWNAGSTTGRSLAGKRTPKELARAHTVRDIVTQ